MRGLGCVRVPKRAATPLASLIANFLLRDKNLKGHVRGCSGGGVVIRTSPKEIIGRAIQGLSQLVERVRTGRVLASLTLRDQRAAQACMLRQLFLRPTLGVPETFHAIWSKWHGFGTLCEPLQG